ncbi:aldo/keto reductase [Streptomyces noursei]|uniref:aldo/keto reductase n=1 Tax=Streptomyces noursei TaxID=1971 RepID=UPI003317A055
MTAALALGTYRCRDVSEAAKAALDVGVDWIDTAPNYHGGEAERLLAPVLATNPTVRVSTKVGYLTKANLADAVEAGVVLPSEAECGHSIRPDFVTWQCARSKAALGRSPDILFLHNPEHGHAESASFERRLVPAFEALEESCCRGDLHGYGVATWDAFDKGVTAVGRLVSLARAVGGPGHHLKALQLPLSLIKIKYLAHGLSGIGVLRDAEWAGLDVLASAPLHGGELLDIVTPAVAQELGAGLSPLEVTLGAVASTPGVRRVLLSASTAEHWTAATAATSRPLRPLRLRRIVDAFST